MTIEADLKKRLFAQFGKSPNIQALIEILATVQQDTADVCDFILDHSSIDTAEGDQLDKKASRIGVTRPPAQESRLFTLVRQGEVQDPEKGFTTSTLAGGYLPSKNGLEDQADPDATMPDAEFRKLIRQKATAYRSKMTHEIMFLYLIAFGAQCVLDDDETYQLWIDPVRWQDLNHLTRNYIETRGFKPACISVNFIGNLRHEAAI
jgi:hypothetical protein